MTARSVARVARAARVACMAPAALATGWLALLVAVAALPSTMGAQVAGAAACSPAIVYNEDPSPEPRNAVERMHPLRSRARLAADVQLGRWDVALAELRAGAAAALVEGRVEPEATDTFLAQLDTVIRVLPGIPAGEPQRGQYLAAVLVRTRFQPVAGLSGYTLFERSGHVVDVGALSSPQQRALCWSALSVDQLLRRLGRGMDAAALSRLGRLNASWDNYRSYGYTRQPLELLAFRSSMSVHDTLPPVNQVLLGHLSAGAEVQWRDSVRSVGVAVVEVVGVLHYRRDFTQYHGVSAIVSVPSGRRPAAGVMVHAARSLRAGLLWRREGGRWVTSAVASTDLYGLLGGSKRSVEQWAAIARGRVLLGNDEERK